MYSTPTYRKGDYTFCIDHIFVNDKAFSKTINFNITNRLECLSENKPVACELKSTKEDPVEMIEMVIKLESGLKRILLKAARIAEFESGLVTRNGISKGSMVICTGHDEILKIMNRLRHLRMQEDDHNNETIKYLQQKLRKLQ